MGKRINTMEMKGVLLKRKISNILIIVQMVQLSQPSMSEMSLFHLHRLLSRWQMVSWEKILKFWNTRIIWNICRQFVYDTNYYLIDYSIICKCFIHSIIFIFVSISVVCSFIYVFILFVYFIFFNFYGSVCIL